MQISLKSLKRIDIIKVTGRLDGVGVDDLETAISDLANRKRFSLIIDCSELSYINSAGLRVLMATLKQCKSHSGHLVFAHVNEQITDTFSIVGFQSLFEQFDTILDAVDSFN
ncbi:MAG: STAS domain-containing protein [Anaerolineae bacterium]|nr:STAS domain-containing protein [Anaerolineae bacterium]